MKKGIQKFIAMILALALCAGQLICPVYAVENQEADQPAEEVTVTVIEGGTVTECGTHEQLMAAKGGYCEMFTLQASSYRDEEGSAQ